MEQSILNYLWKCQEQSKATVSQIRPVKMHTTEHHWMQLMWHMMAREVTKQIGYKELIGDDTH